MKIQILLIMLQLTEFTAGTTYHTGEGLHPDEVVVQSKHVAPSLLNCANKCSLQKCDFVYDKENGRCTCFLYVNDYNTENKIGENREDRKNQEKLTGVYYEKENVCVSENGGCHGNARCTNRIGTSGSITCSCNHGYIGDGLTCTDIDECLANNGGCDTKAKCSNTMGSRTCRCKDGYKGDGLTCNDVNECLVENGGCHREANCTNAIGSRVCTCNPGYWGDGVICNVDECLVENGGCHSESNCTNVIGSRVCTCNPGYWGDGVICTDVNECMAGNGGCHSEALCTNTIGSRTCRCNRGYRGDGVNCTDINECSSNNGGCHRKAICKNTIGSRTCTCIKGYRGSGLKCICQEINTDHPGNDIVGIPKVWTWQLCARYCHSNYDCKYWAWANNRYQGPSENVYKCYLKTTSSGRMYFIGVTSGARDCFE